MAETMDADVNSMSYESALLELERTVQQLGKEQEDLAKSVRAFERGLALARRCSILLEQAEERLKLLAGEERRVDA